MSRLIRLIIVIVIVSFLVSGSQTAVAQSTDQVFSHVSAGQYHTCGLTNEGSLLCWGSNSSGQTDIPTNQTFIQVSAGGGHTCGVKADGMLICWGWNGRGQTDVPADQTFTQVSAGNGYTCGLTTDSSLSCWGSTLYGQVDTPAGPSFTQVSAGGYHICGLTTDGSLLCWGDNTYGQTDVPADQSFMEISAGAGHTCGLKATGSLLCWGNNDLGQSNVPIDQAFIHVSAGFRHTCGLTTSGSLLCWGDNRSSQSNVPADQSFTEVSTADVHTCGLTTDGIVLCWGENSHGQTDAPANTAISTNVITATSTPTPSLTSMPGPTSTPDIGTTVNTTTTPIADYFVVTSNVDWTPVEQEFDGVTMVLVPPGCFDMGGDAQAQSWEFGNWLDGVSEGGQQCFDDPFWIDKYEVTQAQFTQLGGQKAEDNWRSGDELPVETITWFEAHEYCVLRGSRLPIESEWEYAARGPDGVIYPWGNTLNTNYAVWNRGFQGTSEVGSIPEGASWVGAMDMSGNVWEWIGTLYQPYPYDVADSQSSYQVDSSAPRAVRGGSWSDTFDVYLRGTTRGGSNPELAEWFTGFRCVRAFNDTTSDAIATPVDPTAEATLTPIPTIASPTSTSVPTAEQPDLTDTTCTATITGTQTLNIRGGPGTQFAVIGQTTVGTVFEVIGFNEDQSWVQIVFPNSPEAWISAQFALLDCVPSTSADQEPTHENDNILLIDTLEDNRLDWELANGSYGVQDSISNGALTMQVTVSNNWEYWVTAPGYSNWATAPVFTEPYEFEFTVDVSAPSGGYGIVILFDVQQGYEPYKRLIVNDDGTWQLFRWSGVRELLAQGTVSNGNLTLDDGNTHIITLQIETDQYRLLIDGTEAASMPSFDPINGTIGVGAARGSARTGEQFIVRFDQLSVSSLR